MSTIPFTKSTSLLTLQYRNDLDHDIQSSGLQVLALKKKEKKTVVTTCPLTPEDSLSCAFEEALSVVGPHQCPLV